MRRQDGMAAEEPVPITFAAPGRGDQPEHSELSVMSRLQHAAASAKRDAQDALAIARELSQRLREAEDQLKEMQADVRRSRERADRAERWLHKIAHEIEERFFEKNDPLGLGEFGHDASAERNPG